MAKNNNNNPANSTTSDLPDDFIPMTNGRLRLEVPEKPGYHRHWFRGEPARIARARKARYEFVDPDDPTVDITSFDIAGDGLRNGNSDLGSRVSVVTGDEIMHDGQPSRLYLMECPIEYYEASKKVIDDVNSNIASALRGGKMGVSEPSMAYNKEAAPNLFTPKNQRRP